MRADKIFKVNVPGELIDFIKNGERFLVVGHKEPDGDCVGCQLALKSALERLGKQAAACSAGPFNRPEVKPYANFFASSASDFIGGNEKSAPARVILVDCSSPERAGDLEPIIKGLPLAVIDHHAVFDGPPSTAEAPRFIMAESPSCTILVQALLGELGAGITKEEADFLFLGLCTDTGFFRHLEADGGAAFESAAELAALGASAKKTYNAISNGKSLNSRILMGRILSRIQTFFGGKLVLSHETLEESKALGQEGRDSDSLYLLLQSVTGVEAIVIIRQESPDNCTVGLRSKDGVDVSLVASSLGGGGHKNAAGLSIKGTIGETEKKILDAFAHVF